MNQPITPAYAVLSCLDNIDYLTAAISKWAENKGFWQQVGDAKDAEKIRLMKKMEKCALMMTELGELVEALRKPTVMMEGTDVTNEEEELADLVIRAFDYAGHYKLRLAHAIGVKMAKNEGRPFMHGKLA